MDGYSYNLDPYGQASAPYFAPRYTPSYTLDPRSSYGLPASDAYVRVPVDPYAGYGAPPSYPPDVVLRPRYASPPTSPAFRSRPLPGPNRNPPPSQNLGPMKKPFTQTQKVRFSEEEGRPSQKALEKKPFQATAFLAKETQDLHSLFRTGVDPHTGKMFKEITRNQDEGNKRKAETEAQKSTPVKKVKQSVMKRQKLKKNKKTKRRRRWGHTPYVYVPVPMTVEEKKEAELDLVLQRGLRDRVCEFLGVPPVLVKQETKEEVPLAESDTKPEDSKEVEKPLKPEEPERTLEEEQEADEKSFEYFSKFFEENEDLRKIYVDKCYSGSFECLVCYSENSKKKFQSMVGLVMHTKTRKQKRAEHRGYGRAVCGVLGWDYRRNPNFPRSRMQRILADKSGEQVKEEEKSETDGTSTDIEEDADNTTEEHEEEKAAESSKELTEE